MRGALLTELCIGSGFDGGAGFCGGACLGIGEGERVLGVASGLDGGRGGGHFSGGGSSPVSDGSCFGGG